MQPPGFLQFKGLKKPTIYAKNMKNAKNINVNLYCNFSPRFLESYFQQRGHDPSLRIAYVYTSSVYD